MSQINRFNGDYIFLSNFYPVEVEYNGILYPSVEHAYQAQKTLNEDIRLDFSKINKDRACDAKKKSYSIKKREDWDIIKLSIMKDLLFIKFRETPLKEMLLSTDNAILIEGNQWGDTFWGVCNNQGANMLGILLTYVRHCLRYDNTY